MTLLRAAVAAGLQRCGSRGGLKPAACGLVWLLAQAPLFACPVCFQIEDGHAAAGVRAAVWVLMGITVVVLGGFAVFVRRLIGRA
jgi:hypothetical protein